jgi:hypothetical protein
MRMVYMSTEQDELDFARRAASYMAADPKIFTYTDGPIQQGCLFAVRFGLGDDCVVVMRLAHDHVPTNFQNLIREVPAAPPPVDAEVDDSIF